MLSEIALVYSWPTAYLQTSRGKIKGRTGSEGWFCILNIGAMCYILYVPVIATT